MDHQVIDDEFFMQIPEYCPSCGHDHDTTPCGMLVFNDLAPMYQCQCVLHYKPAATITTTVPSTSSTIFIGAPQICYSYPPPLWNHWDVRFLELAHVVSTWSKDPSTQVGAVIANDKRVLSVGFNGFPQGMEDRPEWYNDRNEKYPRIVHAEINALQFADRRDIPGSTLYTSPFLSCDRCVVQAVQAGITRFVAPSATSEQLERWGAAFERSRKYITECGATYVEIGREHLFFLHDTD